MEVANSRHGGFDAGTALHTRDKVLGWHLDYEPVNGTQQRSISCNGASSHIWEERCRDPDPSPIR